MGDPFDSRQVITDEECARDSSKFCGRRWIYFLERGFNPRATWIRVSFSFNFRFCCSDALATTLSALYGKLLVVMGIAFPMAEVISTYIPPSFYEAFYLYLYFGSMIFLVYMYAMLFRDSKTKPSESKRIVKYLPRPILVSIRRDKYFRFVGNIDSGFTSERACSVGSRVEVDKARRGQTDAPLWQSQPYIPINLHSRAR